VYAVLHHGVGVRDAVESLLRRVPRRVDAGEGGGWVQPRGAGRCTSKSGRPAIEAPHPGPLPARGAREWLWMTLRIALPRPLAGEGWREGMIFSAAAHSRDGCFCMPFAATAFCVPIRTTTAIALPRPLAGEGGVRAGSAQAASTARHARAQDTAAHLLATVVIPAYSSPGVSSDTAAFSFIARIS
jgi:hypothetical protein